jgi:hypothetical protein
MAQDKNEYENEKIDLPANAHYYTQDFPSFLYAPGETWSCDTNKIRNFMEQAYEVLLEIDRAWEGFMIHWKKEEFLITR